MRVLVTGSSGLIGSALCEKLRDTGHVPVRLVRRGATDKGATGSETTSRETTDISWDPTTGTIEAEALEGCDAVVHLAGAGIGDKRWSEARKQEITNSRIGSTHFLLSNHPGHDLAARQMSGQFGAMMSIVMAGGAEAAKKLATSLKLFAFAESLGGVESLVSYPPPPNTPCLLYTSPSPRD